jgi:hypothetical protein
MRTIVKLTPDQKKLVRRYPGLAERVAQEAMRRFGPIKTMAEMVMSAHYGIARAAQSFDDTKDVEFEDWAALNALWTILDDARAEGRQADKIAAGRAAAIFYLRFEHRAARDEDAYLTEEEDRAELNSYKAGVVAGYLRGIAASPPSTGGEDEMITRIDATRTATALDKAHEGFRPEQLELLACESEADLKALELKWGKSWWTLGRMRNKLEKIVGARLRGQKVDANAAWDDDVWSALVSTRGTRGLTEDPVAT